MKEGQGLTEKEIHDIHTLLTRDAPGVLEDWALLDAADQIGQRVLGFLCSLPGEYDDNARFVLPLTSTEIQLMNSITTSVREILTQRGQ